MAVELAGSRGFALQLPSTRTRVAHRGTKGELVPTQYSIGRRSRMSAVHHCQKHTHGCTNTHTHIHALSSSKYNYRTIGSQPKLVFKFNYSPVLVDFTISEVLIWFPPRMLPSSDCGSAFLCHLQSTAYKSCLAMMRLKS